MRNARFPPFGPPLSATLDMAMAARMLDIKDILAAQKAKDRIHDWISGCSPGEQGAGWVTGNQGWGVTLKVSR